MRYCTRQKMLCFRNHHCTVSISLECTNEASEVWSGILEVISLILMKVHACVCMYGLLHYWKKPSVTKKPSTTEKAIHFIKEVFQFVVKQVQMYVHSTDMYSMVLKVRCIIQVNWSFTKLLIYFIWRLRVHLHISVDRRSNRVGTESHHVWQGGSSPKEEWKGEGNISAE